MDFTENHSEYWHQTAGEDFAMASHCFDTKRYNYCLFFCHIAIEKMLKGLAVQNTGSVAPLTHNLLDLLKSARIEIDLDRLSQITEINTFNIRARYDDFKRSFYKKATAEYTTEYFSYAKEIFLWLESQYQNK
jgi:HEPN domain-containing protein